MGTWVYMPFAETPQLTSHCPAGRVSGPGPVKVRPVIAAPVASPLDDPSPQPPTVMGPEIVMVFVGETVLPAANKAKFPLVKTTGVPVKAAPPLVQFGVMRPPVPSPGWEEPLLSHAWAYPTEPWAPALRVTPKTDTSRHEV